MELDFKTVKALSSPTRIKILNQVLSSETTTTDISDELGKTKSTVSSHLSTLNDAGLVEKDEKEGRRRVIYQPTRKAEHIIKGREKKVKFSFGSTAVSVLGGISLAGYGISQKYLGSASRTTSDQATALSAESFNAADAGSAGVETAREGSSQIVQMSPDLLLYLGIILLGFSAISFFYGWTIRKLGE